MYSHLCRTHPAQAKERPPTGHYSMTVRTLVQEQLRKKEDDSNAHMKLLSDARGLGEVYPMVVDAQNLMYHCLI